MIRKALLILATTFAAGLLFVNIYNSLIDAVNWGNDIPASIQTAKDYFKPENPGNFFRIFSPINQVLTLMALIVCWRVNKRLRVYCTVALLIAVTSDVFTFSYFYPRLDIMFKSTLDTSIETIKSAWAEWSAMNWLRSGIVALNVAFDFAALDLLIRDNS